ncbi:MAG: hypothetical protein WCW84_12775 [Sulfurimonas sp.]
MRNDGYNKYIEVSGVKNDSHISKEFDSIIEEVVRYFLNRSQNGYRKIEYTLFNPSISDFVLNKYKNNSAILKHVYLALSSVESLKELRLLNGYGINKSIYEEIILFLYEQLDIESENIDYTIMLLDLVHFINIRRDDIDTIKRNTFIQNMINHPKDFTLIDEFVSMICCIDFDDFEIDNHNFMFKIIENACLEEDVVNSIMKLIDIFYITDAGIIKSINELVNKYVEQELDGYMDDIGTSDVDFKECVDVGFEDGSHTILEKWYSVEDGQIEELIYNGLDEIVKKLDLDKKIIIDRVRITNSINIDEINERLAESYMNTNDYEPEHKDVIRNVVDSIDELFERSK